MLRPSVPGRRVAGVALVAAVGIGIGFGAYTLGNAAGADTTVFPTVATTPAGSPDGSGGPTPTPPTTPDEPPASPLSLEEAQAIALEAAPGRVVEWDEDQEPTGLRYDITVLHENGTSTDVEVDTVTGQVTSIDHDNDLY
jgi:hypothetical protein